MSGPQRHHLVNPDDALATALRRLPGGRPPQDLWPAVAARAKRRPARARQWRIALPIGLAAAIALAIMVPLFMVHHAAVPQARAPEASHSGAHAEMAVASWQQRSRRLQAWVDWLGADSTPINGNTLNEVVDLQDRIGLVDLQLDAARGARAQLPLWRQRVALLQRLAWLRLVDDRVQAGDQHPPHRGLASDATRI
jgi:hypothetical protein